LLITFLILKLTLAGILKECNRMILEQQQLEQNMHLKAELARLEMDYQKGTIDMENYTKRQYEIIQEIDKILNQKNIVKGDDSVEL
jgi:molecular chaperone GrpE (heat shock protein)